MELINGFCYIQERFVIYVLELRVIRIIISLMTVGYLIKFVGIICLSISDLSYEDPNKRIIIHIRWYFVHLGCLKEVNKQIITTSGVIIRLLGSL